MGAPTLLHTHRPRNGKHLSPLLGSQSCGDQRPASGSRLGHQDTEAQAADNAIAAGKVVGERRRPQGKFRQHGSTSLDLAPQSAVLGRIRPIDPAPQHGQRSTLGLERALVRRRIDPICQTADDGKPERGKLPAQLLRNEPAGWRRPARPHDGNRVSVCIEDTTRDRQEEGWIWNGPQEKGIGRVKERGDGRSVALKRAQFLVDVTVLMRSPLAAYSLHPVRAQFPDLPEGGLRGLEHGFRRAKALHEAAQGAGGQPPDVTKQQPRSQRPIRHGGNPFRLYRGR